MALYEYTVKSEGGKRYLVVDCRGSPHGSSVADFPVCMREVVDYLSQTDASVVVLADVYERVYSEEQTAMLKQIGLLADLFHREGMWNTSRLGGQACDRFMPARYNAVAAIAGEFLKSDPIKAYLTLRATLDGEVEGLKTLTPQYQECTKQYVQTLSFMLAGFEKLAIIQKFKVMLQKLGQLPPGREIYHSIFEAEIKPAFVASRVFFGAPTGIELVDQYYIQDAAVNIYKHPEKVQYLYYLSPPEYTLSPEHYFLLSKTREVVASYHPQGLQFADPTEVRKYFTRVYETTITDLAQANSIPLDSQQVTNLANIVARYTVGYGMMELLLLDRKLTDVYMDAPLGAKPVYVVHGEYGTCQTNVMFTEEEAKGIVSRFRAQSGRPFDEAHPVLDMDLSDLKTRVAVIGPPLSPDGIAFALRLHKETPWTLSQFIDAKMINSTAAGLLSFLVDSQASILVTGSRGSGKTSMLQALMLEVLPSLRMIVQEDTLELPVPFMRSLGFNVQRLKTRSPIGVAVTTAEVAPEEALRTALRLGDSVLIIGEVRSKEAQVLYEAMRIGAVGNVVMGSIHGESAYSVWDRIVNDLEVPNTSFKATDAIAVCAPIRFRGSLKSQRRLVEVTEVGKHWYEDPEKENGLTQLLSFDAAKDTHYMLEESLKKSELFSRIASKRGLKVKDLLDDINARAHAKQWLVDQKTKFGIPELLEAKHAVPANGKWLLILEAQREMHGSVDYQQAKRDWQDWFMETQVKPLVARKEAREASLKKKK
ncbi:type II/IV secretion system ATPase subunit [archaeon]|nr:type II/IV secretion system ATPase subunit [archaeon]